MIAFTVHSHDEIGSTSDEARALAEAGAPHGTVVQARVQTAGRGRQARRWQSPAGNLYLSVLLRPDLPPARTPELGFVAALAVADMVDGLLPPDRRAMLKWPNDVLVAGGKVAGILLERGAGDSGGMAGQGDAVILGIGVNLAWAPTDLPYAAASLAGSGAGIVAIEDGLRLLLDHLGRRIAAWEADGFAPVRAAWLARAHPVGQFLAVRDGGRGIDGRFAGLAPDGALLLDTGTGVRRIVAGDVAASLPGPAEGAAR